MVGPARIQNLSRLAQRIEDEHIPGDVVECGVYKGGTAAILARLATHSRLLRTVSLFDSFRICRPPPPPAPKPPVGSAVLPLAPAGWRASFTVPARDLSRVRIVRGLFQDSFPAVHISQIALLNIDADWYESVKLCLEAFYNAVVPRGFQSGLFISLRILANDACSDT
jgi:O-methyltransferase